MVVFTERTVSMSKRGKKKMKTKAKSKSNSKLKLLNIKADGKDRKVLQKKADKYANGNLSAWLRYAGSHFIPKKVGLIA